MPEAAVAEGLLQLVTSRDRASSIIGDLLEESGTRGVLWFWSAVLRTASAHLLHDLWTYRRRMAWLVFLGTLELWVFGTVLGTVVIRIWAGLWPYLIGPHSYYIPPWGFFALLTLMFTAMPFAVAWHMAGCSKGRELATGAAMVSFGAVLFVVRLLRSGTLIHHYEQPYPFDDNALFSFCTSAAFVMAGAIARRVRSIRRGAPPAWVRRIRNLWPMVPFFVAALVMLAAVYLRFCGPGVWRR